MKKGYAFGILLLAAVLAACGGGAVGAVNLDGSSAMSEAVSVLREIFAEKRPDIRINCSGSGSGAGIEGALSGVCDIGLSSRALTAEEIARGAEGHLLAWDEIVVIVHPDNPVRTMSAGTLAGIFTGKLRWWSDLGGEGRPIAVYGREAGSGTRDAFEETFGIAGQCAYTNEYCSTGDVLGNVAGNPNAIGYVSRSAVNETVAVIPLDCLLRRPFLLVTCRDNPLSEAAAAFLEFATGEEGAKYLPLSGVAPAWEGEP